MTSSSQVKAGSAAATAPCDARVAVAGRASLESGPATPAGQPIRVSPPDVF